MSLGGWMSFTLYIAAARRSANEEQLKRLREEVLPTIKDLKRRDLTAAQTKRLLGIILMQVQTIMGKDWRPDDKTMEYINQLTGKTKADQESYLTAERVRQRRQHAAEIRRLRNVHAMGRRSPNAEHTHGTGEPGRPQGSGAESSEDGWKAQQGYQEGSSAQGEQGEA